MPARLPQLEPVLRKVGNRSSAERLGLAVVEATSVCTGLTAGHRIQGVKVEAMRGGDAGFPILRLELEPMFGS